MTRGQQINTDPETDREQKVIPFARLYTVFNVEQCENLALPSLETVEEMEPETNEAAFDNLDFYYTTAYHEIVHWTGHPARLQRQFGKRFGDQEYAFEELVAEIGAAAAKAQSAADFVLAKAGLAAEAAEDLPEAA